jgi:polyhydroxybutyrate depolymerase
MGKVMHRSFVSVHAGTRRARLWLVLLAAALTVAGCSGSSKPSSSPASGALGSSSAASGSATAGAPRPSSGCSGTATAPGRTTVKFDAAGRSGSYVREVPPAYTGRTPMPLVVDLHGYAESADLQAQLSGLGSLGATRGFITVTPQLTGPVPNWVPDLGSQDVAYAGALFDELGRSLCLDQRRIYVTGYSNGAMLTSALMCAYSDRIAAAAPVAGLREIPGCRPSRPVPLVAFHGTQDSFVPYDGSPSRSAAMLPAPDGSGRKLGDLGDEKVPGADITRSVLTGGAAMPDILAGWATRENCSSGPPATSAIGSDVTVLRYSCPAGSAVELYRIAGGGHAWPGSSGSAALGRVVGRTTFTVNADEVMWDFLQAHPLPA